MEILKKNNKDISQERLNRFKEIIRHENGEPHVHISEKFELRKITSKVTCFSEIDNNLLMWAHYSDKHRGACNGFNTNLLYSDFKFDGFLNNVKYSRKIITKKLSKLREQAISHWICSKGNDWRYDKEVRIILGPNYSEFVQFNICSIEEIIFGAKLTEDDKLNIEKLIYNENKFDWIKTSEMKISEIAYRNIAQKKGDLSLKY